MSLFDKIFGEIFGEKNTQTEKELLDSLEKQIQEAVKKLVNEYIKANLPVIKFEKLSEDATIPTYADEFAEGMDLYSPVSLTIPPHSQANIKLGIKADIPNGYWLMFKSRSGLSWKNGLEVGAGVIDNNYKAELGLIIHNHNSRPYMISKGDRIGQAVPMRRNVLAILESKVEDGTRDGFGSTGK